MARRSEPLDRLAKDLTSAGATAHVITADLSDTGATPRLAEQIRAEAGNLVRALYTDDEQRLLPGFVIDLDEHTALLLAGSAARETRSAPAISQVVKLSRSKSSRSNRFGSSWATLPAMTEPFAPLERRIER